MRVLIAEDNRTVADTLADMLGASEHEVVGKVGSGIEAIHAYDQHKPDVVLMDCLMSRLNGVTACRNIMAKDRAARVVLVSGSMAPEDLASSHCGAFAILQKPLRLSQLKELLASVPEREPDVSEAA